MEVRRDPVVVYPLRLLPVQTPVVPLPLAVGVLHLAKVATWSCIRARRLGARLGVSSFKPARARVARVAMLPCLPVIRLEVQRAGR